MGIEVESGVGYGFIINNDNLFLDIVKRKGLDPEYLIDNVVEAQEIFGQHYNHLTLAFMGNGSDEKGVFIKESFVSAYQQEGSTPTQIFEHQNVPGSKQLSEVASFFCIPEDEIGNWFFSAIT